jgi:hypothetical protein
VFSDHTHPSDFDTPESNLRFSMMLAELWHDWFEAMSEVAYRTHRACEFLAENGGLTKGRSGPFDFRSAQGPSGGSDGSGGPLDLDALKQCLQSMDPMQARRVMHAVQMMEFLEAMAKRRRSHAHESEEEAPW